MPRLQLQSQAETLHRARAGKRAAGRTSARIGRWNGAAADLAALAYAGLRFIALLVVGVLAVWSLVLLFG